MNDQGPKVIVVGGGLCGLSAAHTVLERGGHVILLDKNAFLGGNSTRATSGINGAGTSSQRTLGVAVRAWKKSRGNSCNDLGSVLSI